MILPLVEDGLLKHGGVDDIDMADLKSALVDLRTAMSGPDDEEQGDAK